MLKSKIYSLLKWPYLKYLNLRLKGSIRTTNSKEILGQQFHYPKFSFSFQALFQDFENTKLLSLQEECELLNKEFFDNASVNIVDIGANIGYQSLAYSHFLSTNRFLCFEPVSDNYYYLQKNISHIKNIELFKFALGKEEKEETISMPRWESQSRLSNLGLMSIRGGTGEFSELIHVKKFDNLEVSFDKQEHIFIKIDVEGYEYNVLLGMQSFLESHNNIFFNIELNSRIGSDNIEQIKMISNFLERNSFVPYTISKGALRELTFDALYQKVIDDLVVNSYFKRKEYSTKQAT